MESVAGSAAAVQREESRLTLGTPVVATYGTVLYLTGAQGALAIDDNLRFVSAGHALHSQVLGVVALDTVRVLCTLIQATLTPATLQISEPD